MDTDMVKAVGDLWPLAFVAFLFLFALLFRKQVGGLLERLTKFQVRKGQTEISASYDAKKIESEERPQVSGVVSDVKPTKEPIEQFPEAQPASSEDWILEMVRAYILRDQKRGEEAFDRAQQAETNAVQKLKNNALRLRLRYEHGDASALPQLQDMANQEGVNQSLLHIVHRSIGYCYQSASSFVQAIEAFENAAQLSETEVERANDIIAIAECLHKMNKEPAALKRLMHEIGSLTHADALSILYNGLASFYEKAENREFRAIALEKALEIQPNNPDLHFGAAYSYAEKEFRSLSLFHYRTLLHFKPDYAAALNNIGVLYKSLEMPVKSVNTFKEAIKLDHTLAMANIAYGYLDAGFEEEALQILDRAKQQKEPHPNVGRAISAISDRKETELKKEETELNVAGEQQRYILDFADAYFSEKPDCPSFSGLWRTSDGIEIDIAHGITDIEGYWTVGKTKYKIIGTVINRGAIVSIYQEEYVWSSSKLEFVLNRKGYAYLAADGQKLSIMTMKEGRHTFIELAKAG